jgi:uncharacterized damage-inducible protein DinB
MTDIDRSDPPLRASETDTLRGYLDYQRATLRTKTYDLSADQLRATLTPSTMTLGGMLKHLALVEQWWFNEVFLGNAQLEPWASVDWDADEDWDWHSADNDSPEQLRAIFDAATTASDEIIATALVDGGLDQLSVRESRRAEGAFSLRWIILHMIEEYARHNGHADLLRESIDGVTGE